MLIDIDSSLNSEHFQFTVSNSYDDLTIDMDNPTAGNSERDRFVLVLTSDYTSNGNTLIWSNTGIVWENNTAPAILSNETLICEFWENDDADGWYGSYKSYNGTYVNLIALPYDIAFSSSGLLQPNLIVGSFAITRDITIEAGAAGSYAYADVAAIDAPYTMQLIVKSNSGATINNIGTVLFPIGNNDGVITITSQVDLAPGHVIQLATDNTTPDSALKNIGITIVSESMVDITPVAPEPQF